jgi:hypothetical protein
MMKGVAVQVGIDQHAGAGPVRVQLIAVCAVSERDLHADILREQLDGAIGMNAQVASLVEHDSAFWETRRATIERAARAADPTNAPRQSR